MNRQQRRAMGQRSSRATAERLKHLEPRQALNIFNEVVEAGEYKPAVYRLIVQAQQTLEKLVNESEGESADVVPIGGDEEE